MSDQHLEMFDPAFEERNNKMKDIVAYLQRRDIKYLVHFTPINNLEGIKRKGIVPRSPLEEAGGNDFRALDEMRIDGRTTFSCFSISFPNFMMMHRYRTLLKKERTDVALLFIDIETLLSFEPRQVAFYPANAASREWMRVDPASRAGLDAVESLFAEEATTKSGKIFKRSAVELPQFLTTNPQAEVQIDGVIPWRDVKHVVVDGWNNKKELEKELGGKTVYATWKLNFSKQLNVFEIPKVWGLWLEKKDVADGE